MFQAVKERSLKATLGLCLTESYKSNMPNASCSVSSHMHKDPVADSYSSNAKILLFIIVVLQGPNRYQVLIEVVTSRHQLVCSVTAHIVSVQCCQGTVANWAYA